MPKSRTLAVYSSARRWTEADARVVLAALGASGLSTREFALREGLDAQRLYFWKRRLESCAAPAERTAVVPAFVELRPRVPGHVEVVLCSGRVLRVSETIEPATLRRFLEILEEEPRC